MTNFSSKNKKGQIIDKPVLFLSGGALLAFVILAWFNQEMVTESVNYLFNLSATYFGAIYQFLMLGTFFIALFLGYSKYGKIRLGKLDKPEMSILNGFLLLCVHYLRQVAYSGLLLNH